MKRTRYFGPPICVPRKLADWMAARGFLVLVPDFFHGDPIVPDMDPALRDSWFQRHDAVRCTTWCVAMMVTWHQGAQKLHYEMQPFFEFGYLIDTIL